MEHDNKTLKRTWQHEKKDIEFKLAEEHRKVEHFVESEIENKEKILLLSSRVDELEKTREDLLKKLEEKIMQKEEEQKTTEDLGERNKSLSEELDITKGLLQEEKKMVKEKETECEQLSASIKKLESNLV